MNTQARHCLNCAYNHNGNCLRSGESIGITRAFRSPHCDKDFSGWCQAPDKPALEPPKPKRSLRQWLYDTLIA